MQTDDQYFAELATAGVTVFASSGDDGSTPGPNGTGDDSGPLQPESPASDPNVTAVGGTTLILNGNNTEASEVVWNGGSHGGASGGGISGYWDRPSWQTGTGVQSGAKRQVPDVACSADPNYGAAVIQGGVRQTVGGTSWSSPTWAGFSALINQARANSGQQSLGLLGPHIYPLLNSPDYSAIYLANFRDITSGNNATTFSNGKYAATAGYDLCTGMGVPLVQPLTQLLVGSSPLVGIQMPSPVQEIAPGQNAAFTVAVGGSSATYQWQRMPVGSSTWSSLSDDDTYSGSTAATLNIANATTVMSGDQFQCLITLGSSTETTTPPCVLVVDTPLVISTLAGKLGTTGTKNGSGTAAEFDYPSSVAVDTSGNIYVADYGNNQIREVTSQGVVSTPYGNLNGAAGSSNGTGNSAQFDTPNAIAADSSNNLYVADSGNNIIRKIVGNSVSTLAGTSNQFNNPEGIAVDGSGNVYVADTGNNTIRKITSDGTVSILAGQTGVAGDTDGAATTQALFNGPTGVAVDGLGNVYVADFNNSVIRKISSGMVTTVAGQAGQAGYLDGLGTNALFNAPVGLAVDSSNNVYIADSLVPYTGVSTGNNLVRKLTPAGVVSTLAGQPGVTGSANGTGTRAQFYSLQGVAIGSSGSIYLADTYNQTIRAGSVLGAPVIGNATITLEGLSVTYDGTAKSATATTNPPGLGVSITYNGSATPPTNAGSYTVVATINAANYQGSVTGTMVIGKATATVTLGNLAAIYNGMPQSATATTNPSGLNVTFIYNSTVTTPTHAGSYTVIGTVSDPNYQGSARGTFVIAAAPATVTLGSLAASYDGKAQPVTATTNPVGLPVTFTYNGKATVPTAVGSYTVVGTVNSADYIGSATNTLVISKGAATVVFGNLAFSYTGKAHSATATTTPAKLAVTFTYGDDNSPTAPTLVGSYAVVGTISNPNYTGTATSVLSIAAVAPVATTAAATLVTATSAKLNGTVNPEGAATTVYFQYGTTNGYGSTTGSQSVAAGTAVVPFSASISLPPLTVSTIYHYRAVAVNASNGALMGVGADKTFTTPGLPIFGPDLGAYLGASGAEVSMSVIPNGIATSVSFQYSTSSDFSSYLQTATQTVGSGKTPVTVYALFPDLSPDTLYYYRMVTTSAAGSSMSDVQSFTTLGFDTTLVASKGDFAVGSSGPTLASFGNPAINTNDDVAFAATLTLATGSVTTANDAGIWTEDHSTGARTLIAQTGSGAAPGTTANFLTLGDPVYNNNGAVAFRATLKVAAGQATSTTATGVWEGDSAGDLALVARQGSPAPGTGGTFNTFTALGLSDTGTVFVLATLNNSTAAGITTANNTGIWEGNATDGLTLLLRLGDTISGTAPGATITKLTFLPVETYVSGQTRSFNSSSGDFVCGATFSDKSSGIIKVIGGMPQLAILSGFGK